LYLGLPLFLLISGLLFNARTKTVESVSFSAINQVNAAESSGMRVMQFDASLEELELLSLCGPSSGSQITYRNNRTCEELEILSKTSLQKCDKNAIVSTITKGRGSYYYPNKPVWNEEEMRWNFGNSQRFYLTGSAVWHSLDKKQNVIVFYGYPTLCSTCTFYKLPCDQEIDEALLGIGIVLIIRAVLYSIKAFGELNHVRFVSTFEQHPRISPKQLQDEKQMRKIFVASELSLWGLVGWLSYTVFLSRTCEDSVPELYYGAMIFLTEMYIVFIGSIYMYTKKILQDDADPGQCNHFCEHRFSNTVMFLPCGHVPGYGESKSISIQQSNKMCLPCSKAFEECPICKRVIEKRKKVFRGNLPPVILAVISFLQMVLPAICAKWNFMHSACLKRDVEPQVTTNGCTFLLFSCGAMLLLGVVGIQVAEKPSERPGLVKVYRIATIFWAIYCAFIGLQYLRGLIRALVTVSSEFEVTLSRNMGFSDKCISEVLFPHAFKSLFPNTCLHAEKESIFYEFFSCKACDKTSPASCYNSAKYLDQQTYTNWAAMGYMLLAIVDVFGFTAISAVVSASKRFERETEMRNKPVIQMASDAFRQLLAKHGTEITAKSTFANESDSFGESWHAEIRKDPRYNPLYAKGKKRGHPILSDENREDIFMAFVENRSNSASDPTIATVVGTVVEESKQEQNESLSGGGFEGPH
jgi:hypothetical protein